MSTLFVCNTGGHLVELLSLAERLPFERGEELWVTFDDAQSRSLLRGRDVEFIRYPSPRDLRVTVANTITAIELHRRRRFTWAVSTGAGVAVSFLPVARAHGAQCHYIESATRIAGPSMTGRLLAAVPGIGLHTQTTRWSGRRWSYVGSIFDGFEAVDAAPACTHSVVVSLGSSQTFGFRRLVAKVADILPPGSEVLWQTGSTPVDDLGLPTVPYLAAGLLESAFATADVVVAHAGVGTALTALRAGRFPILVPRESGHGEHVDDHQFEVAAQLQARGLALCRTVDELCSDDLITASSRRVQRAASPPTLDLRRRGARVGFCHPCL